MNSRWWKLCDYFPRFMEEFQLNERQSGASVAKAVTSLVEHLYSVGGADNRLDDEVLQTKLEALMTHFDLKRISITELLGEEDCKTIRTRVTEVFLPYEDWLVDKEFWSDKQVATLAKILDKESSEINPRDFTLIGRLVDHIYSNKQESSAKEEFSTFDPYTFFSSYRNQKVFVHSLLLQRYKYKGSAVELGSSSFRLLLSSFQFICLNFMNGKQDAKLLYDIMRLSSVFYQKTSNRKAFLIENLNKMALWSDKAVWGLLYQQFCSLQQERAKVDEEKTVQGVLFFTSTLKKLVGQEDKPELTPKMRENAVEELGMLLFSLAFKYEFIAEILLAVVDDFDLERKVAIKILKKNEDKLVKELFEKLNTIDTSKVNKANLLSRVVLGRLQAISLATSYLDCKSILELGLASKSLWKTIKPVLHDQILLQESSISHSFRLKLWGEHILPQFSQCNLQSLELSDEDEIIILDVKRTYPNHSNFNKDTLIRILKNIKVHMDGKVCYYQGLNYIVGYILNLTKDPGFTYRLTLSLLETKMSHFVTEDLKNMKVAFYIFNRILQLYLPKLHERLKNERVGVEIFSASWFLTIFTTVSQSDPDSKTLLDIMDTFVAGGWPAFYRVLIRILELRHSEIEKLNYEDIMMVFFNLTKSSLFRDPRSRVSLKPQPAKSMQDGEENYRDSNYNLGVSIASSSDGQSKSGGERSPHEGNSLTDYWPAVDLKSGNSHIRVDQKLLDSLMVEYKGVALQIANFWKFYGESPSANASPSRK